MNSPDHSVFKKVILPVLVILLIVLIYPPVLQAQNGEISRKLEGFDQYMDGILKDWNVPGVAVGVVAKDKLVFAKGYGYRDYDKKLPMTPNTLFQIGSNTKLFTAVAVGMLTEEGKLEWDKPVRQYVPTMRFCNDELNNTVTIRDMLAHRTGITRHDLIWYKSDFTRKELFERLKYLKPVQPLRQAFLYNNMMYAASGYIIELLTQKTWEDFLRERIFERLGMNNTVFSVEAMKKHPEHSVPYKAKLNSPTLIQIPHYEDQGGIGPAGSIISSIQELSRWLIALMNEGKYQDKQVIPPQVLKATLEPAIALANTALETRGYRELLNPVYGMGRCFASYKGHYLTYHGGGIGGCFSRVSSMPYDEVGVLVFVIGAHCRPLPTIISYNLYERLVGLDQTPWSERRLEIRRKSKKALREARAKAGRDRVPNTKPSHALVDYVGDYEHPAYGILKIGMKDNELQFIARKIQLPLRHYHYDRFDTPDVEKLGKFSVNFITNPQGDIDRAVMSLDEAEATFTRKHKAPDHRLLQKLAGYYETPSGIKFQVVLKQEDGSLYRVVPGRPDEKLIHYKGLKFRRQRFSDRVYEFAAENDQIKALKSRTPNGEFVYTRIE